MNMNPDETALALWLDDELTGDEFAAVEAWAGGQPEQIAARDDIRTWRATMAAAIPSSEEPPYPDFFNSRVMQSIRDRKPAPVEAVSRGSSWKSWFMPMAACAGMILTFWIGRKFKTTPDYDFAGAPKAIPVEPVVYTPENGVKAEWVGGSKAAATVIVLNGVTAFPDETDFSETVYLPTESEMDFTADREAQPELEVGP